ncbi:hypothetical protein [Halorussus litoreus]|uniref:hypothetical protein n=1 Tax=Halorussus litoreus TaxID=1710536 RepID=UPI000E22CFC3|nr:hypothetical protein [Halorussus litoreus]
MATSRRIEPTLAAWGLAGIPILATLIQTTLAMLETTLGAAGLAALQDAIRSVAVFDEAAVLMWQSPTLVFGLFVLIAGAWLAQGVAQFARGNRDVTFAAAGLVSVLFFALFLGVYLPMFGSDVPTAQVVAFFAVPVVASGAAIGAALAHDWEGTVVEEKSAELAEVSAELDRKREAFEEAYRRRIGDLDALEDVAPTGVEQARESRREFLDSCDEIAADASAAERGSADQLRAEAASLRSRVEELDPEGEVERIDGELRDRVASGIRTTYGTVQSWSRYDREYELVNLPARFRDVDLAALDSSVHVDQVSDALLDRIERDEDLETIAAAVENVESHLARVNEHVAEREATFAETAAAAESDVETVRTKVERFDGAIADRLSELVVEGRREGTAGVGDVEDRLAEGRDALHDCQFDDAERAAEAAAADAGDLVTVVEFVWSVVGTVDHDGDRVSLPAGVDPALVEELRPAFASQYGAQLRVEGDAVRIDYEDAPAAGSPAGGTAEAGGAGSAGAADAAGRAAATERTDAGDRESAGAGASGRGASSGHGSSTAEAGAGGGSVDSADRAARPEETIDSVLFVFRELKNAGRATDDDRAELQTGDLPETVATPAVLAQIERFGQRQTDVIESLDVQENAPPGFVELVPKEGTSVERAIDALHGRYQEQYG